jgi:protein-disulfide isomerase
MLASSVCCARAAPLFIRNTVLLELRMRGPWKSSLCLLVPALLGAAAPASRAGAANISADTEVAVIGDQRITFGDLSDGVRGELADSEQHYQRRLHQLALEHERAQQTLIETRSQNLMDNRLLHLEAQAQRTTVEELIKGVKPAEVTDQAVRAFYDQHQEQLKQPVEAVMPSIMQLLMRQAADKARDEYLSGLRARYAARVTLRPLREDVEATGPSRGAQAARVTIVEFADFQCPYCRQMAPLLHRILAKYPQDVRLVYRQMPLANLHPDAMHAAQASLCAAEQGRFWDMHDALFADPPALSIAALKDTAARLQLKQTQFVTCLDSGKTEPLVKADADAGRTYGVDGTPGLFINGRYFSGAMTLERLAGLVDDELRRQSAHLARADTPAKQP